MFLFQINFLTGKCFSPCALAMSSSMQGAFSQFIFQANFPINLMIISSLYLAHFTTGPLYMFYILAVVTFPVAVAKSGIALLQVFHL